MNTPIFRKENIMKTVFGKGAVKNKLYAVIVGLFVFIANIGVHLAGPMDCYSENLYLDLDKTYVNYFDLFDLVPSSELYYRLGSKVAIYTDVGTNAESILAVFRAVAAMGHQVYGIAKSDIERGRLTTDNFDVLILPPAEPYSSSVFPAGNYYINLFQINDEINDYVDAGGGFVGLQHGARYACSNYPGYLNLYPGEYSQEDYDNTAIGKETIDIVDPLFGSGNQEVYLSAGPGNFTLDGGETVATDADNKPVIVRYSAGSRRVILSAAELSLRGDSELDWTIWDNWEMGDAHTNSVGAWKLLGRMIDWAAGGNAAEPNISASNPDGDYVAVISTHTSDGGAAPKLLPAIGRSIEYAGHTPLAIRFEDVKNNELTISNFDVVVFPGGYAYGYKQGLSGHESEILDFIENGGGYLGICAGSYYAADYISWDGSVYYYPLDLFSGYDIGPIDAIAGLEADGTLTYALTPTNISDPVIGDMGTQQQLYYGGGWKWSFGGHTTIATYNDYYATPNAVRFTYGTGHVLLVGTHPEALIGSNEDWLFWDNYAYNSDTPLNNPDNPWEFVDAIFNNWLIH